MTVSETQMEDALLLHVSECSQCLVATKAHRRLSETGCEDFRRLAEQYQLPAEVTEAIAVGEGHLNDDLLEEYSFGRLTPVEKSAADRHLASCEECRTNFAAHREFIACLKYALKSCATPNAEDSPAVTSITGPRFDAAMISAAQDKLPVSRLAGIEALRLMENSSVSLDQLDRVLKADPVLSAHLIRVANSALFSFGHEARTIGQAIGRIGLERTKLHVCGLAVKRMYTTPHLQRIWNHSVLAAQVSRELAGMTGALRTDEASLAGLVHDIGHIVLAGLGPTFERARTQRLAKGLMPIEIEEELCGMTHAAIGANLLESWKFPLDLTEAVRNHHTPSDRVTPFSSLLFLAEHWLDNQEEYCDVGMFRSSMLRLGLTSADLRNLGVKNSPDLELLRFAA